MALKPKFPRGLHEIFDRLEIAMLRIALLVILALGLYRFIRSDWIETANPPPRTFPGIAPNSATAGDKP
jgi:hypothetical protein